MPYKDKEKQLECQRRHYRANKEARLDLNRKRKQEIKTMIRDMKDNKSCMDCGVSYRYYVMEFDHLPGTKKHSHPAELYKTGWGNERILEELSKCELVCANCHRERTMGRKL